MSIKNQLATSLDRRDEVPNQELAVKLVQTKNKDAIKEVVSLLQDKDKNIQADCIKVLYEIGALQPALIKDYVDDFVKLLSSKNNRLAWGGMTALNYITSERPEAIYKLLPVLIEAAEKGSVITRDNFVMILIRLEENNNYRGKVFPLLLEQLVTCPVNQLPMYAERALPVIDDSNKQAFVTSLQDLLEEMETESKRKRILKVIKALK
jgi:hypothetical protein